MKIYYGLALMMIAVIGSSVPGKCQLNAGEPSTQPEILIRTRMLDSVRAIRSDTRASDLITFSVDSAFIMKYPESYYSWTKLAFHIHEFPLHQTERIYKEYSATLGQTDPGKVLKRKMDTELSGYTAGDTLQDFSWTTVEKTVSNYAEVFRDRKVVIVDFWASSCISCRQNSPRLKELYELSKGHGLGILSISLDKDASKWLEAIRKDGIGDWHHGRELVDQAIVASFGVVDIPAYYVIDSTGTVLGRFSGNRFGMAKMDQVIAHALSGN